MNKFNKSIWALGLACIGLFSTVHADNHDLIIKSIKRGRLELLKTLINKENANELLCVDGIEMTPFFLACREAEDSIVLWLMQFKPDVNIEIDGSDPLHEVVKNELTNTAFFLIEMGADLKKENKRGETPLAMAKRLNLRGMISRLTQSERAWTGKNLDFNIIPGRLYDIMQQVLWSTLCSKDKFYYLRKVFERYSSNLGNYDVDWVLNNRVEVVETVINTLDAETIRENEEAVAFWKQEIEKSKSSSSEEN